MKNLLQAFSWFQNIRLNIQNSITTHKILKSLKKYESTISGKVKGSFPRDCLTLLTDQKEFIKVPILFHFLHIYLFESQSY